MSEYTRHLANMHDKTTIVATADILSDQGVLIAKSGTKINTNVCERLLKFKLLKPVEDSISIENQLNAKSLYNHVNQFIAQDKWLSAINQTKGDKQVLQQCCLRLDDYPLLQQKLTVLQLEIPHVFSQALFSAFLAYICGIVDKLPQKEIENYFLAGITHDIGFLHIDSTILKKEQELTTEEVYTLQSHPAISYEILRNMENFPKSVARAALEHHENLDGSGYPKHKTSHDLESLGQLIRLLDNVIGIYNKKFKNKSRSIYCAIPILQTNMHSFFPHVFSMVIRTLKYAPEPAKNFCDTSNNKQLLSITQDKQNYIIQISSIIKETNSELGYQHNDKKVLSIQNTGNNILFIVNSAGLYDTNYIKTLVSMESNETGCVTDEIEEALAMLSEIIYYFQNYQKAANIFVSKDSSNPLAEPLKKGLDKIKAIAKPKSYEEEINNLAEPFEDMKFSENY